MKNGAIDISIKVLKTVGKNNLLFGTFLIAEGLSLIFVPIVFPIFIVLSILIAYAFAIEWFINVIRGERTLWNIIQRAFAIIIIIAILIYCGFTIFDADFRITADRILVCATTIVDGINNLVQSLKVESRPIFRNTFAGFSGLCILYGIIYGIVGGAEENFFTTTIHGIIFILCGLTNLYLYIRAHRLENQLEKA